MFGSSKQALKAALEASGNELAGTDMFEKFTVHLANDQLEQDTLLAENLQSTGRKGEKKIRYGVFEALELYSSPWELLSSFWVNSALLVRTDNFVRSPLSIIDRLIKSLASSMLDDKSPVRRTVMVDDNSLR